MKRNSTLVRLFNAQGKRCCYCTKQMTLKLNKPLTATVEHITPRSHGGENALHNYACACYACNQERGNTPLIIYLLNRRNKVLP